MAPDVEARATAEQIRVAGSRLKQLAGQFGLSSLRLTDDGTVVLHVDHDPSYRPVLQFIGAATHLLGAEPHVVTDDAPIAERLAATPL